MTHDAPTDTAAPGPVPTRGRALGTVAIWLSVVALAATAFLVVPFLAPRNPLVIPVFLLAFAGAFVGLVLGLRARRGRDGAGRSAGWALAGALIALVVDVVLAIVFATLIVFHPPTPVELRGSGPNNIEVTFSNDFETRTLVWPPEGRAEFNTDGTWAEISVTAPADAPDKTVSCQIEWDGEIVVEQTSDTGSVTCRYDEG